MRMNSVLKSNHDLKKNGYRIIRKLHKLESREGAERAYKADINDSYYFVLSCRALVDIINLEYPTAQKFKITCDAFLEHLDSIATRKARIDRKKLSSFLHSYTCFFNEVIEKKHVFVVNQGITDAWNTRCLMAYIAAWGTNRRNR